MQHLALPQSSRRFWFAVQIRCLESRKEPGLTRFVRPNHPETELAHDPSIQIKRLLMLSQAGKEREGCGGGSMVGS